MKEILARTQEDLQREGIECSTMVDEGDPAEVLVGLAAECEADLLVIGNKGMHRRVLGSVPNTITHNAPCSVFVVKTICETEVEAGRGRPVTGSAPAHRRRTPRPPASRAGARR